MKVQQHETENVINRIAIYREQFCRSLSHFDTFGRGWLPRNDETRKQAIAVGYRLTSLAPFSDYLQGTTHQLKFQKKGTLLGLARYLRH